MNRFKDILAIWAILQALGMQAQDISQIAQTKDPIKINGSISTNQILYAVTNIPSRRLPYNYFYTGNLNLSIYGLSIPISYTFSNQQSQFRQPFNQYGIQPSYKWVKTYIGYSNMVFSPYSLNGHIFLGGGVELTPPGFFRLSAMYGRLQKAAAEDTTTKNNLPMFQRMGYGLKTGIGKGNDFIDFVLFHAKDKINSLSSIPEYSDVTPEENLVLGINFSKSIAKRVTFTGEYSNSAYSQDIRAAEGVGYNSFVYKITTPLFIPRNSTSYYNAFRTNITYAIPGFSFGVGYEKIDPNYRTLGAYYFNNDLENITLNSSKKLFKGKINLSGSVGLQRNNLNNQKTATMRRVISAINVTYAPSSRLNLSGGYSNFQSFTRIRSQFDRINQLTPYDNLDTLNYVQLTQSANLNSNIMLGNIQDSKKRQSINLALTYQVAGETSGNNKNISSGTVFYNGSMGYQYMWVPYNLNINTSVNANISKLGENRAIMLGPTIGVTKAAFENKLRTNISCSWNKSFAETTNNNARVFNIRLTESYLFRKKHNFNLSLVLLNRNKTLNSLGFTEYTATIGYIFNF